jgi:Response regulator containing CheY-like receiver domain and AraC-type DNA-binding domain
MNLAKNPQKFIMYLIISYSVIIFLSIQILSWALYMNFDKIGTNIITSLETRNLYLVSDNIDNTFESARSLCKQIYTDHDVQKLMYGIPLEINDANTIIDRMASYSNVSSDVQSIYIYSKKLDYYYCTLTSLSGSSTDFYDKEACAIINNLNGTDFNPIPRIIKRQYTNSEISNIAQVYTFVLYDYGADRKTADGAVIVNINASSITSKLKSLAFESNSSYMLLDDTKKVMGSSRADTFLSNMSGEKAIDILFNQDRASSYLKETINHNDSIITYITSQNPKWKFIRITPYRAFFSMLYIMKNSVIIISFIILALALFAMIPLYKNISPPIHILVKKIQSLEEIHRDNYNSLRQEILHSLLFESSSINTMSKHMDEFNIKLDLKKSFLIVLAAVDNFNTFAVENDKDNKKMLLSSIGNIAVEVTADYLACEFIQISPDKLAVIINIDEIGNIDMPDVAFEDSFIKTINAILSKIQYLVKERIDISISYTVSNKIRCFKDIPQDLSKMIELSNYRLIYGHSSIIWASDFKNTRNKNPYKYPTNKENQLFEQLMLGKPNNAIAIYKDMVNDSITYSYNDLMAFFNSLALSINSFILKLDHTTNIDIKFEFYEFSKFLNSSETLDQINARFEALFKEVCDSLTVDKEDKSERLISQIIKYIEENYHDPNLSLNIIAENVDKSPVYLGRVYKKLTGNSIQDSINEVRLDRSRKLLSQTQLTVQEICNKVGIGNEKYFYIFFKKNTGITPSEYRNKRLQI